MEVILSKALLKNELSPRSSDCDFEAPETGLGWKENLFKGGVVILLLSREATLIRGDIPSEVSALLPNGEGREDERRGRRRDQREERRVGMGRREEENKGDKR